jgi:UDP-N-acetylmuramoyl-L-alanyl-D-glutamate--2,6-diaminopimelate ligase
MNLERLIAALGPGEVVNEAPGGADPVEVRDLAYDARSVVPGSLFFCVRGTAADGHAFAPEAEARGAVALVVDRPVESRLPQVVVPDVRGSMPAAAVEFFGDPVRGV